MIFHPGLEPTAGQSSEVDWDPVLRLPEGTVIARRYALGEVIGRGGFGTVYAATDSLACGRVAVKILDGMGHGEHPRVRRELSALRLLRIPGVVNLLDDGVCEHGLYLVMDLVEGQPFPAGRTTWSALAETANALLETLSRIHAAGVVHRDIKPSNVLVTAAGRPVVLDFGLAVGPGLGPAITRTGAIVGTPAYLAPEQIEGGAVGPATDLYAIGLLLYEALTGRRPHPGGDTRGQILARLALDPVPLRFVAPQVTHRVAEVIEWLLARDPANRPQSVAHVLAALAGETPRSDATLPWLGTLAPVHSLLAAARRREPVRLHGAPGSGRTRCLRAVADTLANEGRFVRWLAPGIRPFDSLSWLLTQAADEAQSLAALTRGIEDSLGAELDAGLVIIADDAHGIDQCTRELLRRRSAGAVLTTDADAPWPCVALASLGPDDLRGLFEGPDRLLHLREDAARVLFDRTDGIPRAIAEEVGAWVRVGLAEARDGLVSTNRLALDRLRAGTPLGPVWGALESPRARSANTATGALQSHHKELLGWIELARPAIDLPRLAIAMNEPLWRVEAEVQQLCELGFISRTRDGALRIARNQHVARQWSEERRRAAHAGLADTLEVGTERRLSHLVLGGVLPAVAREGLALARQKVREGKLGAAASALAEALVAERAGDGSGEQELLVEWVKVALQRGTVEALDHALYELGRTRPSKTLTALEELLRVALHVRRTVGESTLEEAERVQPFGDPELDVHLMRCLQGAARGCPATVERRVLTTTRSWAEAVGQPWAWAHFESWQGSYLYRLGRFGESARCHMRAARQASNPLDRITSRISAASSLVEAFRPADAVPLAEQARDEAAGLRHHLIEGRAEWIARTARYRLEQPLRPDMELADAARKVGSPDLTALIGLTEGAIAWRCGDLQRGAELGRLAVEQWLPMNRTSETALVSSLAFVCGDHSETEETLEQRARGATVPALRIQALALLALGGMAIESTEGDRSALETAVPTAHRESRLDVLSVAECEAALADNQGACGRVLG